MTSPRLDGPFAATRRYGANPLALAFDVLTLPFQISNTLTGVPPVEIPDLSQGAPLPTPTPTYAYKFNVGDRVCYSSYYTGEITARFPGTVVTNNINIYQILPDDTSALAYEMRYETELTLESAPTTPPPDDTTPPPDTTTTPRGAINLKTDYGLTGDGVTDETPAILRAIQENIINRGSILYFPPGTYLVSDRLRWQDSAGTWRGFLTFVGDGPEASIIKLMDSAPGFNDPANPKAVIFTASQGGSYGPAVDWANLGEGNEGFQNFIFDLSVDTGSNNPGAIGIDYLASNVGAIRTVEVRSGDGQGFAGIRLVRKWPGPCYLKNVTVEGFDYGIRAYQNQYSITFEHITLTNQRIAGVHNENNVLSFRDLKSFNTVPAIQNVGPLGLVVVLDSALNGGDPAVSAIENDAGELFARGVTTTGYLSVIRDLNVTVPGSVVTEFVSSATQNLFPPSLASLNLAILETPELPQDSLANSVSVADFGAVSGDVSIDNLPAFQAAIDSGFPTVFAPPGGRYAFSGPPVVRGNVRRFDLMGCLLGATLTNNFGGVEPLIRVESGTQSVVLIERVGGWWKDGAPWTVLGAGIQHASTATLVIRDGAGGFDKTPGSGDIFLENVGMGFPQSIVDGGNVRGRQINPESQEPNIESYILNNGGNLWFLGMKTEKPNTTIKTINGGFTEVLGGFLYPVWPVPSGVAAFVAEESTMSLVYATQGTDYAVQVRETQGGQTLELLKASVLPRGGGSVVPLYTGG
jgi:hypothetical protein